MEETKQNEANHLVKRIGDKMRSSHSQIQKQHSKIRHLTLLHFGNKTSLHKQPNTQQSASILIMKNTLNIAEVVSMVIE